MKKIAKSLFGKLQAYLGGARRGTHVNVVAPGIGNDDKAEVLARIAFYLPGAAQSVTFHSELSLPVVMSGAPILLFGVKRELLGQRIRAHSGVFDIDFRTNPVDGWHWIDAGNYAAAYVPDVTGARDRFFDYVRSSGLSRFDRCYVFGTGPSLGRAAERNWSDGIRVVCNTIVRDSVLWRHIDPHLLVAGDAIYHFGFTEFALAFRRDLRARLETSEVLFMYPAQFDRVVRDDLGHLAHRLVPIPEGQHVIVHEDFRTNFTTPALGNVLNRLLLPLACNLSKRVCLWGFDGRAPSDQLFWANAPLQSYTELIPTLQRAHPAFFDNFVPKLDPEAYVRSMHGDVLEHCLASAEAQGWAFEMQHPTWTPTLARRVAAGVAVRPLPAEVD